MIPTIGVMIGLYILTRMVELFGTSPKRHLKLLASVTGAGSLLGIGALIVNSNVLPDLGPRHSAAIDVPVSPPESVVGTASDTEPTRETWSVSETKNPIDDTPTVVLRLEAVSGRSRFGDAPTLLLRCSSKKTDVYVSWYQFMGSDAVDVTTRIGHGGAITTSWSLSTDNKATFYPGSSVKFIKSLMEADTLVVSATPYSESPVIAIFPLAGLSEKITPLQTACGWK